MRIAHVTATFPPYWAGTGNVAYHQARLAHERGHDVTVFTAAYPVDDTLSFPFTVERLPASLRLGNAPLTPQLTRHLRGFDLIHLHYPYIFGAELVLLASVLYRIPFVLTYHNRLTETHTLKRSAFAIYNRTIEPLLLRAAARVLAVRREHFAHVNPRFAARGAVVEVPNGVDTQMFKPVDTEAARAHIGVPLDAPIALFVGALDQAHRFKNVDGLLRAFADVQLPDAHLVVVGDGDLRPSLEALAGSLGVGARAHFVGSQAPVTLPAYYSAADVTVLPSTSVESFGLVIIESMACGTPVIASDLPGVRTLVDDGCDGRRVPPGDDIALASALTDLLSDREAARRAGSLGRRKVRRHFDWSCVGNGLDRVYAEVVGR